MNSHPRLVWNLLLGLLCTSIGSPAARAGVPDGATTAQWIKPLDLGGDKADTIDDLVVDPQGRIVTLGTTSTAPGFRSIFLMRLLPSGTLDSTFANGGVLVDPFELNPIGDSSSGSAVKLMADGSIIVGGTWHAPQFSRFLVGTVSSGGAFLGGGSLDFPQSTSSVLEDLAIDPTGAIVAVGTVTVKNEHSEFGIVRIHALGLLDTTFSGDGFFTHGFPFVGTGPHLASSVALDGAGNIIVAGSAWFQKTAEDGNYNFALVKVTNTGGLEPTFGFGGSQTYPYDYGGTLNDVGHSVLVDRLGRIVLAGEAAIGPNVGNKVWAVLRTSSSGIVDSTFGFQGFAVGTYACGGASVCANRDSAVSVREQSNGSLLIAGTSFDTTLGHQVLGAARLSGSGALDPLFGGVEGAITWNVVYGTGAGHDLGRAMVVEKDGSLMIGGSTQFNGFDTDLAWIRVANALLFSDGFESGDTSGWAP